MGMCGSTWTSRAIAMKSSLLFVPNAIQSFSPSAWKVTRQDLLPPSISQNERGVEQIGTPQFHCGIELNPGVAPDIMTRACKPWIRHQASTLVWETGAHGSCNASPVITGKSGTVKPVVLLTLIHSWMAFKKDREGETKTPSFCNIYCLWVVFFPYTVMLDAHKHFPKSQAKTGLKILIFWSKQRLVSRSSVSKSEMSTVLSLCTYL